MHQNIKLQRNVVQFNSHKLHLVIRLIFCLGPFLACHSPHPSATTSSGPLSSRTEQNIPPDLDCEQTIEPMENTTDSIENSSEWMDHSKNEGKTSLEHSENEEESSLEDVASIDLGQASSVPSLGSSSVVAPSHQIVASDNMTDVCYPLFPLKPPFQPGLVIEQPSNHSQQDPGCAEQFDQPQTISVTESIPQIDEIITENTEPVLASDVLIQPLPITSFLKRRQVGNHVELKIYDATDDALPEVAAVLHTDDAKLTSNYSLVNASGEIVNKTFGGWLDALRDPAQKSVTIYDQDMQVLGHIQGAGSKKQGSTTFTVYDDENNPIVDAVLDHVSKSAMLKMRFMFGASLTFAELHSNKGTGQCEGAKPMSGQCWTMTTMPELDIQPSVLYILSAVLVDYAEHLIRLEHLRSSQFIAFSGPLQIEREQSGHNIQLALQDAKSLTIPLQGLGAVTYSASKPWVYASYKMLNQQGEPIGTIQSSWLDNWVAPDKKSRVVYDGNGKLMGRIRGRSRIKNVTRFELYDNNNKILAQLLFDDVLKEGVIKSSTSNVQNIGRLAPVVEKEKCLTCLNKSAQYWRLDADMDASLDARMVYALATLVIQYAEQPQASTLDFKHLLLDDTVRVGSSVAPVRMRTFPDSSEMLYRSQLIFASEQDTPMSEPVAVVRRWFHHHLFSPFDNYTMSDKNGNEVASSSQKMFALFPTMVVKNSRGELVGSFGFNELSNCFSVDTKDVDIYNNQGKYIAFARINSRLGQIAFHAIEPRTGWARFGNLAAMDKIVTMGSIEKKQHRLGASWLVQIDPKQTVIDPTLLHFLIGVFADRE